MHSRLSSTPAPTKMQPGRPMAPLRPGRALRATVKTTASANHHCPYSALGVTANASDTEIKHAYRKLVLQYHPDVNHAHGAERRFMSIQQAYELLTGKSRGADGRNSQRGDWDFNDWYWSFMQKRRWGGYKKAAAAAAGSGAGAASSTSAEAGSTPFHHQPQHKDALRSQLAGLRHRAAVRANRRQPRWATAAADEADGGDNTEHEEAGATSSLEYDSSEMGDGCNMASGINDWQAAAAAHAAHAAKQRFNASEGHKQQVMSQVAGMHRMAAATQEAGGMW